MSYLTSSPSTLLYQSPSQSYNPSLMSSPSQSSLYQHHQNLHGNGMSSSISMPSLSSYNQYYEDVAPTMLMLPEHSNPTSLQPSLQLAPSPVKMERSRTTTAIPNEEQYIVTQPIAPMYHQRYNSNGSDYFVNPTPAAAPPPPPTPLSTKRHSAPAPSTLATERARSNSTSSIYNHNLGPIFQTPLRRNNILSPSSTSTSSSGLMTPGSVSSISSNSAWALYNNTRNPTYPSSVTATPASPMTPGGKRPEFGAGVKLSFVSTPSTLNGSPLNSPSTAITTPSTGGGINPFYKPSAYIQQQTQNFSSGSPAPKKSPSLIQNDFKSSVMKSGPPPIMGSLSSTPTGPSSTSSTVTSTPVNTTSTATTTTTSTAAAAAAAAAALEVQSYSPPLSAAPSLTSSEPPSAPNSPDSPITDPSYSQTTLVKTEDIQQQHILNYSFIPPQPSYQYFDTPANINPDGSLALNNLPMAPQGRPAKSTITPAKPHRCHDCLKTFRRLEHLKRHAKIHTEERPFTCDIVGCNRKFSRSDNLRAHRKTHMKPGGRNIYIEDLATRNPLKH